MKRRKYKKRITKKIKKRRIKKYRQIGKSVLKYDRRFKAKKPGKRKSSTGNIYYEYRTNRSDIGRWI